MHSLLLLQLKEDMLLGTVIRSYFLSSKSSIALVIAMDVMVVGSIALLLSSDIMEPCLMPHTLIKTSKLHAITTHNTLLLESMMSLESLTHLSQSRMVLSVFTFKPKEISCHTVEVSSMESAVNMIMQLLQSAMETKEALTIGLFVTHGVPHGEKPVILELGLMATAKSPLIQFL